MYITTYISQLITYFMGFIKLRTHVRYVLMYTVNQCLLFTYVCCVHVWVVYDDETNFSTALQEDVGVTLWSTSLATTQLFYVDKVNRKLEKDFLQNVPGGEYKQTHSAIKHGEGILSFY